MPAIYQGDKKIVDRYVGETLITRAYQGDKLILDAYSELSGTLPLYVRSRASQVLKNYIIYGESVQDGTPTPEEPVEVTGLGVETENVWDGKVSSVILRQVLTDGTNRAAFVISQPGVYTVKCFNDHSGYTYCKKYTISTDTYDTAKPLSLPSSDSHTRYAITAIVDTDNIFLVYDPLREDIPEAAAQFNRSKLCVVEGSTPPASYIPHGYKLPITVTSNGTTTDYPVYIGDSKLMAEEYVDYEEQKVYRCYGELILKGNEDNLYYYGKFVGVNAFYIDLLDNQQLVTGHPYLWCNHYEVKEQISPALDKSCRYQAPGSDQHTWNIGRIYLFDDDYASLSEYRTHLTELYNANTPLKIRYLLKDAPTPTDPPVPLPDITLPQGTVTIDTEEEFKYNSAIKGRINPVHYAYSINADTAEITYLADNKNFTPAAMGSTTFNYGSWENAFFIPRPCMLKSNGKVDYYLDPNDYGKKLDGTASDIADPTYDGNVMLEFPKIYYKFVPTGDDGEGGTFHCSNVKLDDSYECWCNYDANNNEIDYFYVAAYNAVILDNKMRSLSGYALTQENGADTTTGATEISAARANNQNGIDEWYTYLLSDHQLLTYLATLMCKHVNHQAKFGRGVDLGSTATKRAYVTGTLNDKGLFWGDTSTGTQGVKIFGIENFYACVWKRAAGLIGTSTGYSYKLTHGTKDGSTATSFNTNGSGYKTIARTKPANGYVTTMHYEANGFWIPATTGTNLYGDYYYNGAGYALVGGYSGNGSYCGSWYVTLNNGVGVSYWGFSSALSCKPKA